MRYAIRTSGRMGGPTAGKEARCQGRVADPLPARPFSNHVVAVMLLEMLHGDRDLFAADLSFLSTPDEGTAT